MKNDNLTNCLFPNKMNRFRNKSNKMLTTIIKNQYDDLNKSFNSHRSNENSFKEIKEKDIHKIEKLKNDENLNYIIKDNKLANFDSKIKDVLNSYEGEGRMSKFDVKNLINSNSYKKNNKKKIPSIKDIDVNYIKPFLEQNLKIKCNKKFSLRSPCSIKLNFATTNLKKNKLEKLRSCKDIIQLEKIDNFKKRLNLNKKRFKLEFSRNDLNN